MAESSTEVLVGGTVLAVAAAFVVYVSNATGGNGAGRDSYELTASFRSLQGVSVGTDVSLAGVKIGEITQIELNPVTFRADTRFSVRKDLMLPEDSAILVSAEGLLGGNFIEIIPGGSPDNLMPGDEIEDTQGSISIVNLLAKFAAGSGGDGGEAQ